MKQIVLLLCAAFAPAIGQAQSPSDVLGLNETIRIAVQGDPWLIGSRHREHALAEQAVSAGTLPDPRMNLTAANFPTDTFEVGQEPMTQIAVGFSQVFPRGDTLALSRRQKQQFSAQEPLHRLDRKAKVASMAAQLWLDVYEAQESIRLIEADRGLFDQLVEEARAGYASAVGRSSQQDLIRAQLELVRLEDRLSVLRQRQQSSQQRLSEWIGARANQPLDPVLPAPQAAENLAELSTSMSADEVLYERIRQHPTLLALDRRIDAMATGADLARQKFKPEWGVSAQYGYRADDALGRNRADLFTVGLSFDLPFFTGNRQDRDLGAAVALTDAARSEKDLLARQLMAELRTVIVQIERVEARDQLYARQLLPKLAELAEASLNAYRNDEGDFAEAVHARIAELNARIDALAIAVEYRQLVFRLNYLLARTSVDAERAPE